MPAFRNTGLEGTSSFAQQVWLHRAHKREIYLAKKDGRTVKRQFQTSKNIGPALKVLIAPPYWSAKHSDLLLRYFKSSEPTKHGGDTANNFMLKNNMIRMVDKPKSRHAEYRDIILCVPKSGVL
jgi:hypothetical protein